MAKKRNTRRDAGEGSVYKRGNIWWIAYRVNGKQVSESSGSRDKEVANHLLRERLVTVGRGHGDQFLGWLFEDVANEWYASVEAPGIRADSTMSQWRIALDRHLLPVFGKNFLHQMLDATMYEDYATAKLSNRSLKTGEPLPVGSADEDAEPKPSEPLAASTISHHLTILSMIFDFAVSRNKVELNPIKSVSRSTLQAANFSQADAFERAEVEALLAATEKDEDEFLIFTMARLGLRIGEAFALRVSAYDPENRTLYIGPSVKRKRNGAQFLETRRNRKRGKTAAAERTLTVSKDFAKRLDAHIEAMRTANRIPPAGSPEDGFIFSNTRGEMRHVGNWRNRVWNKAVVAAGLHDESPEAENGRPTPHKLRHTYASEQIAEGVALNKLCYRMGHTNPQTTLRIYTHIFKRHEQDVADIAGLYQLEDDEPADSGSELGKS